MKERNLFFNSDFNGYPVMSSNGSHSEILQRLHERLEFMCSKHCQVFLKTFVIDFPSGYPEQNSNALFIKWLSEFKRRLDNEGLDPAYVWCRESCPSDQSRFHFHLALLVNGSLCQCSLGLLEHAKRYLERTLAIPDASGLVYSCSPESDLSFRHDGFKLIRNDPNFSLVFNESFHYLSYLAKHGSKSPVPGVRTFGCSFLR